MSTSSAIGDDGQGVVNYQIGDDYDAMIAIFWSRLGSKTPRADSGTVEEYERALERHVKGEPIEIGVYFKTANPPMAQIDPAQLQGVLDLRKRMEASGVYHKNFQDEEALSFEIDLFLDRLVRAHQSSSQSHPRNITTTNPIAAMPTKEDQGGDDLGYFDLIESITSHGERMTDFLSHTSEKINNINEVVNAGSQRFNDLSAMGSPDPDEIKKVINKVTGVFNEFNETVEKGVEEFSANMSGLASDSLGLIRVSKDFENDEADVSEARISLSSLLVNMDGAMTGMTQFAQAVSGLQRMTVAFNRARRRLAGNVEKMVNIMMSSRTIIEEALESLP